MPPSRNRLWHYSRRGGPPTWMTERDAVAATHIQKAAYIQKRGRRVQGKGDMWRERAGVRVLLAVLLLPHTAWAVWTQIDSLDNPVDRPDVYLRCIDAVGCVPGLDWSSSSRTRASATLLHRAMTCAAGGISACCVANGAAHSGLLMYAMTPADAERWVEGPAGPQWWRQGTRTCWWSATTGVSRGRSATCSRAATTSGSRTATPHTTGYPSSACAAP